MEIGRKIYYEKSHGIVVWDKGEMSGDVTPTTFDQDKATMPILGVLDAKGQLGTLQFDYGQDSDKFSSCHGYYIDVSTNTVVFL